MRPPQDKPDHQDDIVALFIMLAAVGYLAARIIPYLVQEVLR